MAHDTLGCSRDRLEQCLQDALTAEEQSQLEQHLSDCPQCRSTLEQLAANWQCWSKTSSLLRELQGEEARFTPSAIDPPASGEDAKYQPADFVVDVLLPARTPDAIGRLDDIEILAVVGSGGNGIVLKGWQPELQRLVAVKVMRPELCHNATARMRFVREARAAAAVVHPHVMPIHAVHADGRLPYLVMPFLSCESLQERLDKVGPLALTDVLQIGIQVAQALAAAHAQGLVHRDVKPANILVEKSGCRAVLADFGLARAVDDASVTHAGIVAGTPQFMSPEQARGERIDHRSDLFSLGSVLYVLWTGRAPFRAETTYGVLRRLIENEPRAMSDLRPETPIWFEDLVMWLHQKLPGDRLEPAANVVTLLEQSLRHVLQPAQHPIPADLLFEVDSADSATNPPFSQHPSTSHVRLFLLWGVLAMVIASFLTVSAAGVIILSIQLLPGARPEVQPPSPLNVAASVPEQVPEGDLTPDLKSLGDETPVKLENVETPARIAQVDDQDRAAVVTKYGSAEEAYRVGAAFYSLKEYAKTKEPFEAALKMAPDDAYRIKVYRALMQAYTQESKWQPKAEALEFIIAKTDQDAERSLARRELMGFLRERGKTNEAVKRYEERLKANPKDEATLYILIEVYSRLKDDPRRAAVLLEQWETLKKAGGQEIKVSEAAQLAQEYVKQKKFKEGADLYEKTALRDAKLAAWHYKEAASAWLKAGDKTRAIAAAKASDECTPESRSELLEHFWHRGLADVYFETGEFALSIPHYEAAIAKTNIEGYLKDCQARLDQAEAKAE